jgi:hypothetical protein
MPPRRAALHLIPLRPAVRPLLNALCPSAEPVHSRAEAQVHPGSLPSDRNGSNVFQSMPEGPGQFDIFFRIAKHACPPVELTDPMGQTLPNADQPCQASRGRE